MSLKNFSLALGDPFPYYHEHTQCSSFSLSPTHTLLLPQILTRALMWINPPPQTVPKKATLLRSAKKENYNARQFGKWPRLFFNFFNKTVYWEGVTLTASRSSLLRKSDETTSKNMRIGEPHWKSIWYLVKKSSKPRVWRHLNCYSILLCGCHSLPPLLSGDPTCPEFVIRAREEDADSDFCPTEDWGEAVSPLSEILPSVLNLSQAYVPHMMFSY